MDIKRIKEIEGEIADLKARWPAHSVPPKMWQQLKELEEKLDEAKKQPKEKKGACAPLFSPRNNGYDE